MAAFIVLLVIAALLEPLVFIWAINTLFDLGIDFTFWNWLAALSLSFIILGPSRAKK
jgi:hypothetical protein